MTPFRWLARILRYRRLRRTRKALQAYRSACRAESSSVTWVWPALPAIDAESIAWTIQRADPCGPILFRDLLRKRYRVIAEAVTASLAMPNAKGEGDVTKCPTA